MTLRELAQGILLTLGFAGLLFGLYIMVGGSWKGLMLCVAAVSVTVSLCAAVQWAF